MTSEEFNLKHSLFDDLDYNYSIIGAKNEWKLLTNFINKSAEGSRTFLIVGDYGCGKTFFFQKIIESFKKGKFANSEKSLVISMRLVEGEPESKIGRSFVIRAFQKIGYEKIHDIVTKTSNLDERLVDSNFQKIINGIRDKNRTAYEWLCGYTLTDKEKKLLGISKNLITSTDALNAFYNFLKFLKHAEIENVYLLIDEFEYVVTAYSQKQIDAILYLFKDIYDKYGESKNSMAKTIFIIAMTPGCWDFLMNMEERKGGGGIVPWMERVNPKINRIELLPFSESETIQLLLQRIKENRINNKERIPHESWPFVQPEFFTIIYEMTKGIPRKALKYCDYVFECAIHNNVEKIDGPYTQKILEPL